MAVRLPTTPFSIVIAWGLAIAFFNGCSVNEPRPYYNRQIGAYLIPDGRNASLSVSPKDLTTSSDRGTRLRKAAESYLGVSYRFGGQSRSGMDCSGFVRQVFSDAFQINLPHNSASMASMGTSVSKSDLQPGDVLFFKNVFFIDHSAIYMGQGWFIHSQSGNGVVYTRMDAPYFSTHYAGARRMLR